MARFEGLASIRRALSLPNGDAQLDIKPDGLNWQWCFVSADRAREALACGLTAIAGGWKLYVSLPDDSNSNVLEIIGLTKTRDHPEPPVLYQGSEVGIGGYDLARPDDRVFAFDYNSSGRRDHLVLYRPGTGTIWILKNTNGTFEALRPPSTGDPGIGIGDFNLLSPADRGFAFDYDHSGKLDHLVFYRPGTGTIWILKNTNGTFEALRPPSTGDPGIGIGNYDLLSTADRGFAFDFDHSGKLDHLVFYRPGTGTIWILKNTNGTFQPLAPVSTGSPGVGIGGYDLLLPEDRAFAFDYDNVGKLDHLVLYRPGHGNFWILRNNAGTFTPVVASDTGIRGYDLADANDRAFAFDYNSNGRLDNLVLYRRGAGTIWILNSLNN